MATGGELQEIDALTCPLCLEVFDTPKFLPCHHTFCLQCLEKLTSHIGSRVFPCPQCRRRIAIPPGGVAALQENFYIQSGGLKVAKKDVTTCQAHADQILDLYCVDCQVSACLKCVMTKHKQHVTKDLQEAAGDVGDQLKVDEDRLRMAVTYMTKVVATEKAQQQVVKEKTTAMEGAIRGKYTALVTLAEKVRDEALAALKTLSGEIESRMVEELDSKQKNLDELSLLQRQLQNAVVGDDNSRLLTVAKDMREGPGRPQSMSQLLSPKRTLLAHPTLNSNITEDGLLLHLQGFFGTVEEAKMTVTTPEVEVEEQFRCGKEEKDVDVFSLCPKDDGKKVVISFARRDQKEDCPSEEFAENGAHIVTDENACGKQNWKSLSDGRCIHIPYEEAGLVRSCAKSQKETIFVLSSNVSSKRSADVNTVRVVSDKPVKIEMEKVFTIQVGAHRAFDVDTSEKLFVVVEEAKPPETQRKVRLYRHGRRNAVATYRTSSVIFQPSDVCFYKEQGGREVLVVADEGSDRLHVLDVENGELKFERYLVTDGALLVKPMALNTDSTGRLWVACEGGAILTLTHVQGSLCCFPLPSSESSSKAVKGSSANVLQGFTTFTKLFK